MSAEKKRASQPGSTNGQNGGDDKRATQPSETDFPESSAEDRALEEPAFSVEEFQNLQQELEQARSQAAENFEGWQRERADFMNYKKRIERDQAQSSQTSTGNIIKKYLVILDDLERALKNRPTGSSEVTAWVDGLELIERKLQSILESEGVQLIQAEGKTFDPTIMEAITHEESPDHESGQVIEVVQQGYMLGDRVLRPALVRVAR